MKKQEIFDVVKRIAPKHGLDPYLVMGVIVQESQDRHNSGECNPFIPRLEEGFEERYINYKMNFGTVAGALLAISFGFMQLMAESLRELGYFGDNIDCLVMPQMIERYVNSPEDMIETGCQWLVRKIKDAGGDIDGGLQRWNGGSDADYHTKVRAHAEQLKGEVQ